MHGGGPAVVPGTPLKPEYTEENLPLVRAGFCNLRKQVGGPMIIIYRCRFPNTSTSILNPYDSGLKQDWTGES